MVSLCTLAARTAVVITIIIFSIKSPLYMDRLDIAGVTVA
jgi:hypothetical protein